MCIRDRYQRRVRGNHWLSSWMATPRGWWALILGMSVAAGLPRLRVEGGVLRDEFNRSCILHGVNQVNKMPPFTPQAVGFSETNAELIAAMGHKLVRLGVCWEAIQPFPSREYDSGYLDQVFETVRMLARHGIHTLIDIHQDAFGFKHGGYGAPSWASLGEGPPNEIGFPLIYFGGGNISLVVDHDFDGLWTNQSVPGAKVGLQELYLGMVGWVAGRIRDSHLEGVVVGLEIMNEPFPGSAWHECTTSPANFSIGCREFDGGPYAQFVQRGVEAIRTESKQLIAWFDANGLHGMGARCHIPPILDSTAQLGFSWHNYDASDPTAPFENAQAVLDRGTAGVMTEFGANPNVSEWSEVLWIADKWKSSWAYWAWSNNPGFKFSNTSGRLPPDPREQGLVYDPSKPLVGKNLKWDAIEALSRPYPYLIPGELDTFAFDAKSRKFVVEFWLEPGLLDKSAMEVRTVHLLCSDVIYKTGYTFKTWLSVKGVTASALSKPNDLDLRIGFHGVAAPHQDKPIKVRIEVSPGGPQSGLD
eukprot:TRINITY_DN36738_c0_g1_i3.p1 TRINITY_DN36738_c0_g1~~TRINITY_DN36738_c0_g1_i3.p1  ORF type:complete len:531 (+),score=76.55 TRINITY_DN36738_c0_g1_i3:141-1733(+)